LGVPLNTIISLSHATIKNIWQYIILFLLSAVPYHLIDIVFEFLGPGNIGLAF
jgi:hypothetical protein